MPDCVHAWLVIVPSLFSVAPTHPDALAAQVDGGDVVVLDA